MIGSALREQLEARRKATIRHLFEITHENLGDDFEAWLSWWDRARRSYPQLGPQRLRPRMRLRFINEEPDRAVELTERMICKLGRGSSCDVTINHGATSREHATVLRLHQQLMIRDEGSRFGTRVNGRRVSATFLRTGDTIRLGQIQLIFEAEDLVANPPTAPDGLILVGPNLFDTLCSLDHPSVAVGLLRLVAASQHLDWVERQAIHLFRRPNRARACAEAVRKAYRRRAERAITTLPKLVPELTPDPSPDWHAWAAAVSEAGHQGRLPKQVLPVGWLQPSA